MKLADLKEGTIVTGTNDSLNYQIFPNKQKNFYNSARVCSILKQYSSAKKRVITYIYFVPLIDKKEAHFCVSHSTINDFKKQFNKIVVPYTQFSPDTDLMAQLSKLTEETAKIWWHEYLDFHNGIDQGAGYVIGYFSDEKHRKMLQKIFI